MQPVPPSGKAAHTVKKRQRFMSPVPQCSGIMANIWRHSPGESAPGVLLSSQGLIAVVSSLLLARPLAGYVAHFLCSPLP